MEDKERKRQELFHLLIILNLILRAKEDKERERQERQTWDEQIQPVLDNCKVWVQDYEFYPLARPISKLDSPSQGDLVEHIPLELYIIERDMLNQCNGINAMPGKGLRYDGQTTFYDVLRHLYRTKPDDIKSFYKNVFASFFDKLHEKKRLPSFLEYLRRNPLPWAGKHSNQDLERKKAESVQKIDELLKIARPQVDILEKVRRQIKQPRDIKSSETRAKRKAAVLTEFTARKSELGLIKKEWLEDDELYQESGRPNRVFIGKLLKKIADAKRIRHNGAQKIFEASQKYNTLLKRS
ncbi:MAG: hypothetical protein Q8M92_08750 [Candidatus Subteraquimicrobiales bacterium]|nr:hypothetical protein [Candidatus Subteraquimicrobiales bacterium]